MMSCLAQRSPRPGGLFVRVLFLALIGGRLLAASGSRAADPPVAASEYPLKAVFLFKFIKFVDWPERAFSGTKGPLVIGIVGDDPFGAVLDKVFEGETVQKRPVVLKRLGPTDDLKPCHVLFITRSEKDRVAVLLDQLGTSPVLTIGDTPRFAQQGVVANLVLAGGVIQLEINQAAAKRADLQISSKLLNLDRVVKVNSTPP